MKTDRYHLIDALRGFALINMFVYHALWSMANIFHYKISWFPSFYTYIWQQSGASLFIILSGFCWALSKKHLKRSLVVLSCALFIFICTYFFSKNSAITFGILSFIGSWGVYATYSDRPYATYLLPTNFSGYAVKPLNLVAGDGYEGYEVGANVTLAKNIVAGVKYFDYEARETNNDEQTLWSEVIFTF